MSRRMLWVHGWGTSPRVWSQVKEALPQYEHHDADLSRCREPEELLAAVSRPLLAEPGGWTVVGWSMGGMLALQAVMEAELAGRFPAEAVVPVCATLRFVSRDRRLGWPERIVARMQSRLGGSREDVLREFRELILSGGGARGDGASGPGGAAPDRAAARASASSDGAAAAAGADAEGPTVVDRPPSCSETPGAESSARERGTAKTGPTGAGSLAESMAGGTALSVSEAASESEAEVRSLLAGPPGFSDAGLHAGLEYLMRTDLTDIWQRWIGWRRTLGMGAVSQETGGGSLPAAGLASSGTASEMPKPSGKLAGDTDRGALPEGFPAGSGPGLQPASADFGLRGREPGAANSPARLLWIYGGRDPICPPGAVPSLPAEERIGLPRSGHAPFLTEMGEFMKGLERMLDGN